nr:hypothetical protein CFP56_79280 [Quercus suber]
MRASPLRCVQRQAGYVYVWEGWGCTGGDSDSEVTRPCQGGQGMQAPIFMRFRPCPAIPAHRIVRRCGHTNWSRCWPRKRIVDDQIFDPNRRAHACDGTRFGGYIRGCTWT